VGSNTGCECWGPGLLWTTEVTFCLASRTWGHALELAALTCFPYWLHLFVHLFTSTPVICSLHLAGHSFDQGAAAQASSPAWGLGCSSLTWGEFVFGQLQGHQQVSEKATGIVPSVSHEAVVGSQAGQARARSWPPPCSLCPFLTWAPGDWRSEFLPPC
jgi:hypothetical protein